MAIALIAASVTRQRYRGANIADKKVFFICSESSIAKDQAVNTQDRIQRLTIGKNDQFLGPPGVITCTEVSFGPRGKGDFVILNRGVN